MKVLKKDETIKFKFDSKERFLVKFIKDKARVKAGQIIECGKVVAHTYIKDGYAVLVNEEGETINWGGKVIKDAKENVNP